MDDLCHYMNISVQRTWENLIPILPTSEANSWLFGRIFFQLPPVSCANDHKRSIVYTQSHRRSNIDWHFVCTVGGKFKSHINKTDPARRRTCASSASKGAKQRTSYAQIAAAQRRTIVPQWAVFPGDAINYPDCSRNELRRIFMRLSRLNHL